MTESTDQETPKRLYIIRRAIAIRVILSWLDNDVKWEHFQLNGELWECGICTLLVLLKNKINFETSLKDTTSLVIINLKKCDSAEKLNLLSLDQTIENFQRQCSGNCVSVTRTEKLRVYWLWFLKFQKTSNFKKQQISNNNHFKKQQTSKKQQISETTDFKNNRFQKQKISKNSRFQKTADFK